MSVRIELDAAALAWRDRAAQFATEELIPWEVEAELNALGYRDGVSMVVYRDPADLFDKLRYYQRHASALRRLQDNARIASCHHTWEARARSLRQALGSQS